MYKKAIMLILSLVIITVGGYAQEKSDAWKIAIDIGVNNSQSVYSESWEGDEEGTLTWNSTLNGSAEKQLSTFINSRSVLKLEYGQMQTQNREANIWSGPQKSSDNIDFETVFRFTFDKWVDPYVSGRLQSFFTDERVNPMELFNPMTFTQSAGIAKTLLETEKQLVLTRLGVGTRQKMDRVYFIDEVTGATDSKTIADAGMEWVTEVKTPLFEERVLMTSRLMVFQALYNSESDALEGLENEEYWKATDFDLETIFSASITELIMVNMNLRLIYDKEVNLRGRFKEVLSLGLTYKLI
jgi:hypothetical protein